MLRLSAVVSMRRLTGLLWTGLVQISPPAIEAQIINDVMSHGLTPVLVSQAAKLELQQLFDESVGITGTLMKGC